MIINNGDHLEFELEHANTPKEERPDWPLPSFDALDWAKAFNARHPTVAVDDALAWFAPALMRGYEECSVRRAQEMRATRRRREIRMTWAGYAVMACGVLLAAWSELLLHGLAIAVSGGTWMLAWLWRAMKHV